MSIHNIQGQRKVTIRKDLGLVILQRTLVVTAETSPGIPKDQESRTTRINHKKKDPSQSNIPKEVAQEEVTPAKGILAMAPKSRLIQDRMGQGEAADHRMKVFQTRAHSILEVMMAP